jgi:hypothetical protein
MSDDMQSHRRFGTSILCAIVVSLLLPVIQSGCGRNGEPDLRRYTPNSATAREALDKALDSWHRGDPLGNDIGGSPTIRIVDASRQAGHKLTRYEIIAESSGESPTRFSVRLQLENPSQELEAKYVVVGRDPIWVFREEEYTRPEGM